MCFYSWGNLDLKGHQKAKKTWRVELGSMVYGRKPVNAFLGVQEGSFLMLRLNCKTSKSRNPKQPNNEIPAILLKRGGAASRNAGV